MLHTTTCSKLWQRRPGTTFRSNTLVELLIGSFVTDQAVMCNGDRRPRSENHVSYQGPLNPKSYRLHTLEPSDLLPHKRRPEPGNRHRFTHPRSRYPLATATRSSRIKGWIRDVGFEFRAHPLAVREADVFSVKHAPIQVLSNAHDDGR